MRKRQLNFVVNYRFSAFSAFSAAAGLNLPISLKVCRCDLKCQSCLTSVHPVVMKHPASFSVQTHVTLPLHWVEVLRQEGDQSIHLDLVGNDLDSLTADEPTSSAKSPGCELTKYGDFFARRSGERKTS